MSNQIIPIPKIPILIRPATMDDLPFIDSLQKKHTKQVGFMPTKQFEGKIKAGHVLIAEEPSPLPPPQPSPGVPEEGESSNSLHRYAGGGLGRGRVGYLIGNDQYFKRDDVGIIYQINIAEGKRRSLVGAMLLKAQFDRSAYGCRLYCCWCAQDIEANRFWEAMGFVPLAFRAGSEKKSRVHIFWQKRIRADDNGQGGTPWWFPAKTDGGAIREDRIVLPIPPGKHWSDEMPRVLPALSGVEGPREQLSVASDQLPVKEKKQRARSSPVTGHSPLATPSTLGRLQFVVPKQKKNAGEAPTPRKKQKNDPKLVAAARELRDRWLEKVNSGQYLPGAEGKYDVSRQLAAPTESKPIALLPAA